MATATTLLTLAGDDPGQAAVPVDAGGLELLLRVGAGDELDAGTLLRLLPAPGSDTPVAEEALAAVVAGSAGAPNGSTAQAWISADWGAERPLCCIHVALPAGTPAGKARVKVFSGGVWVPLMPADVIDTGSARRFPPVMASQAMVELVAADEKLPGLWKPAPAAVASLTVRAATLPGDMSLALAGQAPFFRCTGLLAVAGRRVEGFSAAVNAALAPQRDNTVRLTLRALTPGRLLLSFQPALLHVQQVPALAVPLAWTGAGQAAGERALSLGRPKLQLAELSFDAVPDLPPVSLLGAQGPATGSEARYAAAQDGVAQAFALQAPPAPVIGLDLPLRPRGDAFTGTVALHPDVDGHPAPQPWGGAVLPVQWPVEPDVLAADGWLSLDFPRPLRLPAPAWWVVLSLDGGEALWALGEAPPAAVGACLYRQGQAQWLPARANAPRWALARLRLQAPGQAATFALSVRRGAQAVSLQADEQGHVRADAEALRTLNRDEGEQLLLRAQASCAGRLQLSRLRLACR